MSKEYSALPDIKTLEGLLLFGKILAKGSFGVKQPKITDKVYMNLIKMEVLGERKDG